MSRQRRYELDHASNFATITDDSFGHRDLAASLLALVRHCETPFTVGLYAPWGAGKSSVLQELERLCIKEDMPDVLEYDAWKHEGDAFRRAFLLDIGEQLNEGGHLKPLFNYKSWKSRLESDRSDTEDKATIRVKMLFPLFGLAIVAALLLYLSSRAIATLLHVDSAHSQELIVAIAGGIALAVVSQISGALQPRESTISTPRIDDPHGFANAFRDLIRKGYKGSRLVIAIDNLDRCSPPRVDELLSSIKTYLDPAVGERHVVFLIAADHSALRRHLIAQESGDSTDKELERNVEEYLRKFFNAVLRIPALLDEDIRDYTRARLKHFQEDNALTDKQTSRIAELMSAGLRKNPRRIKQFTNNLQFRMEVIDERIKSGLLHLDVDPLVVVKLAILEEEWPEHYSLVSSDPIMMRRMTYISTNSTGETKIDGTDLEIDRTIGSFLRVSADIHAPSLRPYITLKQSEAEASLPNYAEVISAAEAGNSDQVRELISDDPAHGESIEAAFRSNVANQYIGSALNIMRSLLELATTSPILEQPLLTCLTEIARNQSLRKAIGELPLDSLLLSATALPSADDQTRIVAELLKNTDSEALAETMRAVSLHMASFSLEAQDYVRVFCRGRPQQPAAWRELVTDHPGIATDAMTKHVIEALNTCTAGELVEYIACIGSVLTSTPTGLEDSFISALGNRMVKISQSPGDHDTRAIISAWGLDGLKLAFSSPVADKFCIELLDCMQRLDVSLWPVALTSVIHLLSGEPERLAQLSTLVTAGCAADPQRSAISVMTSLDEDATASIRAQCLTDIASVAGGAFGNLAAKELIATASNCGPIIRDEFMPLAMNSAIAHANLEAIAVILDVNPLKDVVKAQATDYLLTTALANNEDRPDLRQAILDAASNGYISISDLPRLERYAAAELFNTRSSASDLLNVLDPVSKGRIIVLIFQQLMEHVSLLHAYPQQIDLIADHIESLSGDRRAQLATGILDAMRADNSRIPQLASVIPRLGLTGDARKSTIRDLVGLERAVSEFAYRVALLQSAADTAGRHKNVKKPLTERLSEIAADDATDVDTQVASAIRL